MAATYNLRISRCANGKRITGWYVAIGDSVQSALEDAFAHYANLRAEYQALESHEVL